MSQLGFAANTVKTSSKAGKAISQQAFLHTHAGTMCAKWEDISQQHTAGYIPVYYETLSAMKKQYLELFDHAHDYHKRFAFFFWFFLLWFDQFRN
jgi:hypothetical protein